MIGSDANKNYTPQKAVVSAQVPKIELRQTCLPPPVVVSMLGAAQAFFVSGRVADMVDYHMGQNLEWEVSREPLAFGGFQRITASAIVRRKPGYFIRNYIIVVYLLTSSSFASFMARPDDFNVNEHLHTVCSWWLRVVKASN